MMLPEWIILLAASLFGLALGSFLNVCIWRLPREGMTVSSPRRSHCPSCGFTIPWYDNLPVLSWLRLGGRCRSCRSPISGRYLAVEALTAMAFAVLADRYLFADGSPRWGSFAAVAALTAACIVMAFIDQDLQIIPDEITIPGMISIPAIALLLPELHLPPDRLVSGALGSARPGLERMAAALPAGLRSGPSTTAAVSAAALAAAICGVLLYRFYWKAVHHERKPLRDCALAAVLGATAGGAPAALALHPEWTLHPSLVSLGSALLGMAVGAGLVFLVGVLARQIFRKEAMGFGDVKLMGFLGGFAGWAGILGGFALACFIGSVVGIWRLLRTRSHYLPFGPYLVMGTLSTVVWPDAFRAALAWYLRLFR